VHIGLIDRNRINPEWSRVAICIVVELRWKLTSVSLARTILVEELVKVIAIFKSRAVDLDLMDWVRRKPGVRRAPV
jgi:hypothetical protein